MTIPYQPLQKSSDQPDCSKWRLWIGEEVEGGEREKGMKTLFVRDTIENRIEVEAARHKVDRIWFCKEWFIPMRPQAATVEKFFDRYDVAVELTPKQVSIAPKFLLRRAQVYLKVGGPEINLKKGDFVCVGPPFKDILFPIESGIKMSPEMYKDDKEI